MRVAVVSKNEATSLLLATGETLEVEGPLDEIAKRLENAARSSAGTLAWFDEAGESRRLGVNPAHVVSVRPTRDRAPTPDGQPPGAARIP
jgi:hypothetical protein